MATNGAKRHEAAKRPEVLPADSPRATMSSKRKTGRRTIGVIGGMGPLATAEFYRCLIRATPAATDQEHLHVLIDSNAEIPDRTAAIEGRGPDPTPLLVETARRLVAAGAEVLVMPCNSAHAFLDPIRGAVPGVPVLDIMEEVTAAAAALRPAPKAAGLLSTAGTMRQRRYHAALSRRGIAVMAPDADGQRVVSEAIASVKAGDTGPAVRGRIREAAETLVRAGAGAIVLGCTELPLILDPDDLAVPVLDGTDILARAAVREGFREYHPPRERSQGSIGASPGPVRRH